MLRPIVRLRFAKLVRHNVPLLACGVALLSVAGSTTWHLAARRELALVQHELGNQHQAMQTERATGAFASQLRPDFTQQLPVATSIEPIVSQLQHSAAALNVTFASVAIDEAASTARTLGRVHLSVTLRGNYPNAKTMLADAFDRYPTLLLERLTVRRVASPTDIEARADLLLPSRPRPASAASGS